MEPKQIGNTPMRLFRRGRIITVVADEEESTFGYGVEFGGKEMMPSEPCVVTKKPMVKIAITGDPLFPLADVMKSRIFPKPAGKFCKSSTPRCDFTLDAWNGLCG